MKRWSRGVCGWELQRVAQTSAMARRAEPILTEADLQPTVESLLITTQVGATDSSPRRGVF